MGETLSRLAGQPLKPTRRPRSTQAEMVAFRAALLEIVAEIEPCTVRQVFYQAIHRALVPKLESEYDRVQIALTDTQFAAPGMLYVALSRCRSLEGVRIVGTPRQFVGKCTVDKKIKGWL